MRNRIRLKLLFISFILPPQDLIYITFTLLSYLLYRVLTVLTLVSPLQTLHIQEIHADFYQKKPVM